MRARPSRRSVDLAIVTALVLVSCGSPGESGPASPSGALGAVSQDAADRAVSGLCEMRTNAGDRDAANRVFYDRSHEQLHAIAAAAQLGDPAVAGRLLRAKERIEADLRPERFPGGFVRNLDALIGATGDALEAIGLEAPRCG
ncbi:MAG: hypothetical protein ACRDH0_07010 [Actinomycetota bacterium]